MSTVMQIFENTKDYENINEVRSHKDLIMEDYISENELEEDNASFTMNHLEKKIKGRNKSGKSVSEIEHKKIHKIKQIEKDVERRNRSPSNRLGKNAKKNSARREFVLREQNSEGETSQDSEEELIIDNTKPLRMPLHRLKRKIGHREKRPETINFEEDNRFEFPEDVYNVI